MSSGKVRYVLEPEDEYTHTPDAASNYNESMYLNAFDVRGGAGSEVGGWFRLGNRVNEGYAEMTVCVYLPGGRVAFAYAKPQITDNSAMRAGGLTIDVVAPFEHLTVNYSGKLCVLADPRQMADPRTALRENPWVPATVDLDYRGVSPMFGGKPVRADGGELELDAEQSFSKAHYEQHCAVTGTITVGHPDHAEVIEIDGLGLRDKSWGPRYWQAIEWYRWLPIVFSDEFAMMVSVVGGRPGGMVLVGDAYHLIRDCTIETEWDADYCQDKLRISATTDHATYDVTGEVLSLVPLRNRRGELFTRITEAMTRYECNGQRGIGMSEYLDQVIDGVPTGPDVASGTTAAPAA